MSLPEKEEKKEDHFANIRKGFTNQSYIIPEMIECILELKDRLDKQDKARDAQKLAQYNLDAKRENTPLM